MIVLLSAVIGILFGAGAFLMLKPDLFRVVIGMVVISNAANLTLMASGLSRGRSPIHPLPQGETVSDPLVQAMTLTAIVIGFGVTALLLSLVYRVYTSHETVDLDDLSHQEARQSEELEREEVHI
ncbi:MAG TPA: sodium:proton antiporter [Gaiellaceae bacterium]|nr:sodium:proton antiporter [Gaiellaceae bacterium]